MRSDVMRWVFSNGMQPVVIGLLVGMAEAIAIARVLRSLLFGITPMDPLSLGDVVLVLLLTSGLACYLPALRAAALDPTAALRQITIEEAAGRDEWGGRECGDQSGRRTRRRLLT
jgi:ABC-type lipoprotein release transport system permease subunit